MRAGSVKFSDASSGFPRYQCARRRTFAKKAVKSSRLGVGALDRRKIFSYHCQGRRTLGMMPNARRGLDVLLRPLVGARVWQNNCLVAEPMTKPVSRQLFIVSRETPYIADYMRQQFRDESNVVVLIDRRQGGDRRCSARPVGVERRRSANRRRSTNVDQQLKESFHALVTVS